jgi:hypothetical protein
MGQREIRTLSKACRCVGHAFMRQCAAGVAGGAQRCQSCCSESRWRIVPCLFMGVWQFVVVWL